MDESFAIPRQPQERLYLVERGPKGVSYREVAFLGWLVDASGITRAHPIGLNGSLFSVPRPGVWIVELAENKFTSPSLGDRVFNNLDEVLRLLEAPLAQAVEKYGQLTSGRRGPEREPIQQKSY
jgi:hypothetical protein